MNEKNYDVLIKLFKKIWPYHMSGEVELLDGFVAGRMGEVSDADREHLWSIAIWNEVDGDHSVLESKDIEGFRHQYGLTLDLAVHLLTPEILNEMIGREESRRVDDDSLADLIDPELPGIFEKFLCKIRDGEAWKDKITRKQKPT